MAPIPSPATANLPAPNATIVSDGAAVAARESHPRAYRLPAYRMVLGFVAIVGVLIAAGLVIVGPLAMSGLIHWDERVVRTLADQRTSGLDAFSKFFSKLADAPSIVAVGAVIGLVLAASRRWRLAVLLAVALAFELLTFLAISYPVGRERPDVVHMGSVPSTGSFPSGHIAATIVLYGFLVLVLKYLRTPAALTWVAAIWMVTAAVAVGWSRVYRGMHHPIDVVAGGLMGLAVLAVFNPVIRHEAQRSDDRQAAERSGDRPSAKRSDDRPFSQHRKERGDQP